MEAAGDANVTSASVKTDDDARVTEDAKIVDGAKANASVAGGTVRRVSVRTKTSVKASGSGVTKTEKEAPLPVQSKDESSVLKQDESDLTDLEYPSEVPAEAAQIDED